MRPRGGIIGASVTPTQSAASGVWTVREAEAYARSGAWPAIAGPPTSVAGTGGAGQVSLTWTAPSSTGGSSITDYTVQYSSNSGSSWTTFTRSASTATSATVTGLTNGTTYIFRVAAVTGYGTGAYSASSSSVTPVSFTATAVLLTSGTSYTVPSGATSMKAWAVGQGGTAAAVGGGAGGTAYKTWSVSGGQSVSYSVGAGVNQAQGSSTTVTFSGTTITGGGGVWGSSLPGGSFSGGDGGAAGGNGYYDGDGRQFGGAVGGNGAVQSCGRQVATDVSGLLSAVALAGGTTTETCGTSAAFGSGGGYDTSVEVWKAAGLGGGGGTETATSARPTGAVVLYFT